MSHLDRLIALGAALLLLGAMPKGTIDPVRIESGLISGATDKRGVTAYLGIPFASPPVGQLRWRPPQAAGHWEGVREADHFGANCMQNEPGSRLPWTEEFMTQGAISEDCLFVNVWTAARSASEKRAVMVFIYGGGFNEGSSSVAVIPYIFETIKLLDRPWEPADFKLSEIMASYWSNFAKTGDPNAPGLPRWPIYEPDSHTTMELGDHAGPIPGADPAKVEFFMGYLKRR